MTRRGSLLSLSLVALAAPPPPPPPEPYGLTIAPWEAPPALWARMVDDAARAPLGSAERAEAVAAARLLREADERGRREARAAWTERAEARA